MPEATITLTHTVLHDKQGRRIFFKAMVAVLLCFVIFQVASVLGPIATFIGLDIVLSVYITLLFRGKYRFLFLMHPVVALISSYGFEIPYTEIGVGFTYLNTFGTLVDITQLTVDSDALWTALFSQQNDNSNFGIGVVYIGIIPVLMLPAYLFADAPDIAIYLSMCVFTVLYAAIAVSVAISFDGLRKDVLLIVALYSTVSPTFLEINSSLHRYGLLSLGLFLFLIAYVRLQKNASVLCKLKLFGLMLLALVLVSVSKATLLLSLVVFVLLERFSRNKLFLFSKIFYGFDKHQRVWIFVIGIAVAQYFASFIVPDKYVYGFSQQGGAYEYLINIPILGLVLRVVYAMLSPFPWLYFDQWDLYGYNMLFFLLHILSALLASWMILSFFSRTGRIISGAVDIRITSLFGVAIMCSLAFSSIGYHVYLAPALPFLAVILLDKKTRVPLVYPLSFIVSMEAIAQLARVIRQLLLTS